MRIFPSAIFAGLKKHFVFLLAALVIQFGGALPQGFAQNLTEEEQKAEAEKHTKLEAFLKDKIAVDREAAPQIYLGALQQLARLYLLQERYGEAESTIQEGMAFIAKSYGQKDSRYFEGLNLLTDLYQKSAQIEKLVPLMQKQIDILEEVLGKGDPDLLKAMDQATFYFYQIGQIAESIDIAERSLAIREKNKRFAEAPYIENLFLLATLYNATGRFAESEPLFLQSIARMKDSKDFDEGGIASAQSYLAASLRAQGKPKEAEAAYLASIQSSEKKYGESVELASALNEAALFYLDQKKSEAAEKPLLRAITMSEKIGAPAQVILAKAQGNLGNSKVLSEDYAGALPLLEQALASLSEHLPEEHPNMNRLRTLRDLAKSKTGAK